VSEIILGANPPKLFNIDQLGERTSNISILGTTGPEGTALPRHCL